MKTKRGPFESKHFRLQQLAEGVYAAIHVDGGAAISNAGIVDLGDRTLVFDAFMTPQAAKDLRGAAEALFDRPIYAVIDSHWHYDHIWGNQVFGADTDIVSSEETRRMFLATRGHGAFEAFMAGAEVNLESTRAQFRAEDDEGQRRQLAVWIDFHEGVVATKPILQIRPPNVTFAERMSFYGTERSAEVIAFEGGHTESDAVLFLPQEGIAFMSDLLFIGYHAYLGGGDPDSLRQILDRVASLGPKVLVPGHGPVGTADSLAQMGRFVGAMDGLAREIVEAGKPEGLIDQLAIPAPWDSWLFASFFPGNIHFLYQRQLRLLGEATG
jgi:cyclase